MNIFITLLLQYVNNLKDGIIVDKPIANASIANGTIRLTSKDSELFLEALDRQPKIYPKLKEAFEQYENGQIKL